MNNKHLRTCMRIVLAFLGTTQAVLAATISTMIGPSGLDLHWDVALLSFAICTLSGVASLLQRINAELKANPGPLPRPFLFCASNILASWVAGALAFLIGQSMRMEVWSELSLMIVASYMGAVFIERYIESRMPKGQEGQQ